MEQNIKKEPPTEYLCILPAFRADKKLSGKQIVKSEDQEQSHYSCEVCNRIFESKSKLKQHLNLHEKQVQCSTCLKFVQKACMKKHLDLHELKKQPPKFKCHICQRAFFIRENLLRHVKEHSMSFECDYCGIIRKQKSLLVDHLKIHIHPDKFKCQICPKTFGTFRRLNSHIVRVHSEPNIACEKCNRKVKTLEEMARHLKVHADKIKCHICSGIYSASSIAAHIKVQHDIKKQEAKFRCHLCVRKFYLKELLQRHLNTHMKPFKCNLCEKRFAKKDCLQDHLAVHADPDIFKCQYCYKKLTDNQCLRHHELRCQRGPYRSFYRCDQCPFEDQSKHKLLCHVIKHRKNKNMSSCRDCSLLAETELEIRKHRSKVHHGRYCAQCDQTFQNKATFEAHNSNHGEIYGNKCRICGMVLKFFRCIKKHMKLHRRFPNQDLSAKCEICQQMFSSYQIKFKHIKQVHQRSEVCSCDLCGKIFMNKSTMANHMINKHTNKPRERFKCDKCSKDYHSKQGLRLHKASHVKKIPFKCHTCSRSLASKNNLLRHLKIHLPEPKAKLNWSRKNPVKCHHCDEIFASGRTLEKHLKSVHDGKTFHRTFVCDKCGDKFPSQENLLQHLKEQIEMRNSIRPLSITLELLNINNVQTKQQLNKKKINVFKQM